MLLAFGLIHIYLTPNSCVQAGDNVGLLLRGLKRDVERSQVSLPDFKIRPEKL
jgi:translation elongation factor EF-Tu-like GTPase